MEFLNDVVAESTTSEVLHTDGSAVNVVEKNVMEIFHSPFVNDEHALAVILFPFLLLAEFPFVYFYMIFVGEPAQGFRISHLLMLHDETHGVGRFAA